MKTLALFILLLLPLTGFGQIGVNFHQSNIPSIGLSYDIIEKVRVESRVSVDNFSDNLSFENMVLYDFLNHDDHEVYTGLGYRNNALAGFVLPLGLNIYPFTSKKFGFHIELALIDEFDILRGSWGIRYRFLK